MEHGAKWYRGLIGSYRKAVKQLKGLSKGPLPKEHNIRLQYVDAVLEARRLDTYIKEEEGLAQQLFGVHWQKGKTDWNHLKVVTAYLTIVHQQIQACTVPTALLTYLAQGQKPENARQYHVSLLHHLNEHGKGIQAVTTALAFHDAKRFGDKTLLHQPMALQAELLQAWQAGLAQIHHAVSWNNLVDVAAGENLQPLTEAAKSWPEAALHLKHALQKTWYEYLMQLAITEYAPLRSFERNTHEEVMQQFKRLDVLNLQYNRARAALQHWDRMPEAEGGGQVSVLRTEFTYTEADERGRAGHTGYKAGVYDEPAVYCELFTTRCNRF
jgi:hypothetical protein